MRVCFCCNVMWIHNAWFSFSSSTVFSTIGNWHGMLKCTIYVFPLPCLGGDYVCRAPQKQTQELGVLAQHFCEAKHLSLDSQKFAWLEFAQTVGLDVMCGKQAPARFINPPFRHVKTPWNSVVLRLSDHQTQGFCLRHLGNMGRNGAKTITLSLGIRD